jgi:hypothetical protein
LPVKNAITKFRAAPMNLLRRTSERLARDSLRNALTLTHGKDFRSIGFPLIGPDRAVSIPSGPRP